MKASAMADGCKFEGWGRQNPDSIWAHTLDGHRLLWFVREKVGWAGMSRMKGILFDEYYEKGRNISLLDELFRAAKRFLEEWKKEIGTEAGFTLEELEAFLRDPQAG